MKETTNIEVIIKKYSNVLLIFLLAIVGATTGILIGYKILAKDGHASTGVIGDDRVAEKLRLNLKADEPFPLVEFSNLEGQTGYIGELFSQKRCALIFADLSCEPCVGFLEQWNETVEPKLLKKAGQMVLLDKNNFTNSDALPSYLHHKTVCLIDMDKFRAEYNLSILPTVVVVDESGKTKFFHYGRRGGIDQEILKFLTINDS